jgi:hypothetical protein
MPEIALAPHASCNKPSSSQLWKMENYEEKKCIYRAVYGVVYHQNKTTILQEDLFLGVQEDF